MAEENHSFHKKVLWGAGISTALGLSPYVLPKLGIGSKLIQDKVIKFCGSATTFGNYGSGLSGFINSNLAKVPGIGESLAAGGWATAITSGVIGIGGTMLGNYISKHYDKSGHIPWGKIIKYAAITTSFLIALPGLLSGISMGLTYLAMVIGNGDAGLATTVKDAVKGTLGFMGPKAMNATGASVGGFISQAVCCGVAALPAIGSIFVPEGKSSNHPAAPVKMPKWTERITHQSDVQAEIIR